MARKFIHSITIDSGYVTALSINSLVASDLPDTTVTPGSYTNATVTVDQQGRVTDAASGSGGYTDEQAQDAVGTILADSDTIDFTYSDGVPSITAAVKAVVARRDEPNSFMGDQDVTGTVTVETPAGTSGGAGGAVSIETGAGGDTATEGGTAGAGGSLTITLGDGGACTAEESGVGGAGGSLTITLGDGGASPEEPGDAGLLVVNLGSSPGGGAGRVSVRKSGGTPIFEINEDAFVATVGGQFRGASGGTFAALYEAPGAAARAVECQAKSGQSSDLIRAYAFGGATIFAVAKNGAVKPASLADADAENGTLYYSKTQSKLVFKDGSGVVRNLY